MRAFIYISCCLLICACSNVNNKEMMVETAADVAEESAAPIASETFQYETIATLKLQELLDLQNLSQSHPEDGAINNQLAALSQSGDFSEILGAKRITKVALIDTPIAINDSVKKLRLNYTAESLNGKSSTDTITAFITIKRFIIDGQEQTATKVVFN